jgi:hypothetical protein
LKQLKNSTTYIVVTDTNNEKTREYMDIYKKYWKLSPIVFISPSQVKDSLGLNRFFITIEVVHSAWTTTSMPQGHQVSISSYWSNFNFRACYKRRGEILQDIVASMSIYCDPKYANSSYILDYSGGHIRNWGPGVFKNIIQELVSALDKGKKRPYNFEVMGKKTMSELKKKTLYVPDYVLLKFNERTRQETWISDEKKIFGSYKFDYKIISIDELNRKIQSDSTTGFYYLSFIRNSSVKYINVVNSLTGEIIYSRFYSEGYNLKYKDLRKLNRSIKLH